MTNISLNMLLKSTKIAVLFIQVVMFGVNFREAKVIAIIFNNLIVARMKDF